jgi:hypothetical protein
MKAKIVVSVGILMLFVAPIILAEDYKKEISVEEAMKAFCGTWFLEGGPEDRLIYNYDGTYGWYYPKIETPTYSGTFKIEKAWKDSEGNIWQIFTLASRSNIWILCKISNNGTVRESVTLYNLDRLPTKIGPNDNKYAKSIKKKNE